MPTPMSHKHFAAHEILTDYPRCFLGDSEQQQKYSTQKAWTFGLVISEQIKESEKLSIDYKQNF